MKKTNPQTHVKQITATGTDELKAQVQRIAAQREWSFAKAAGYLIRRGLEVERAAKQEQAA